MAEQVPVADLYDDICVSPDIPGAGVVAAGPLPASDAMAD
jgi:hypothetical protein